MDAFVLLFTLAILLALGMPVAFAVGLSAVAGALWIELPLEALMIQITSGVNKFTLLAIPFFIPAGAIMAEGGIARRLVNFAYVFVGFIRGGLSLVNIVASTFFRRDFRFIGGGYGLHRQRDDPGDGEKGVSPRVCGGGHRQRVGAGDFNPA